MVRRPLFVALAALIALAGAMGTGCAAHGSPQGGLVSLAHPNHVRPPVGA